MKLVSSLLPKSFYCGTTSFQIHFYHLFFLTIKHSYIQSCLGNPHFKNIPFFEIIKQLCFPHPSIFFKGVPSGRMLMLEWEAPPSEKEQHNLKLMDFEETKLGKQGRGVDLGGLIKMWYMKFLKKKKGRIYLLITTQL